MPTWIDFKELRSKLRFEDVLQEYGVEVKRRGEQHTGFCPLPGHTGKRNSPSFSANLERGIFHCFGCQAKGNVLDFAVLMEKESPEDGRTVKKVAAKLRARFCPDDAKRNGRKPTAAEKPDEAADRQLEMEAVVNAPLDFELQGLDSGHPYLLGRGYLPETIAHFGLGYCARGSLQGRVAIPLHGPDGKLVGYAGRVVDDETITEENPRYRFPSRREREGKVLEFRKSLFLYNGFRVDPGEDLTVVEGFPSVWWLHQHGFPRVVATMGSECSDEQVALILDAVGPLGCVRIMPDGDKAGERMAQSLLVRLAPERLVRWIKIPKDSQPTDLSEEELNHRLGL